MSKPRNHVRLMTMGKRTMPLIDWCREYGMNVGTVSTRLKRGMSLYDALTKSFTPYIERCPKSAFRLLCEQNGIKPSTVYSRIARGVPKDQWFGPIKKPFHAEYGLANRRARCVVVNGEKMTMTEACRRLGLCPSTARMRERMGWSTQDAVTLPKCEAKDRPGRSWAARRCRELASLGLLVK